MFKFSSNKKPIHFQTRFKVGKSNLFVKICTNLSFYGFPRGSFESELKKITRQTRLQICLVVRDEIDLLHMQMRLSGFLHLLFCQTSQKPQRWYLEFVELCCKAKI